MVRHLAGHNQVFVCVCVRARACVRVCVGGEGGTIVLTVLLSGQLAAGVCVCVYVCVCMCARARLCVCVVCWGVRGDGCVDGFVVVSPTCCWLSTPARGREDSGKLWCVPCG